MSKVAAWVLRKRLEHWARPAHRNGEAECFHRMPDDLTVSEVERSAKEASQLEAIKIAHSSGGSKIAEMNKKKPSPLPQAEPEAFEERPVSSFAEARRNARAMLGLAEVEGRIETVPPVVAKLATRSGRQVWKWRYEADAKKRGDWVNEHPLQAAFVDRAKKHTATINKIKRSMKLKADSSKGVDRNRAKGQAARAMVLAYANRPRIAAMKNGKAAHIAKVFRLTERHVRRILRSEKRT